MNLEILPYKDEKFRGAWMEYNIFLYEKFQIKLTYIQILHVYTMLDVESKGDVNKAIAMLKWNIKNENCTLNLPDGIYDKDAVEYI